MSAMSVLLSLCLASLILDSVSSQALRPPTLTLALPSNTLYYSGNPQEVLTLPCVANGYPKPEYEWLFKGRLLQGVVPIQDGTLVFNSPGPDREGVYQCKARNSVGVAISNATLVRMAQHSAFGRAPAQRSAVVGSKLTLACQPQSFGVPMPRNVFTQRDFKWKYENDGSLYPLGRRAQIDEFGNLMIGYVTMDDNGPDNPIACYVSNRILNSDSWGSIVSLTVTDPGPVTSTTPAIMGYTNQSMNSNGLTSTVVALVGRNTTLRCFFSGSIDIQVTWTKTGGQKPIDGRLQELNFGTEFYLRNVQKSDEGQYVCSSGRIGAADFQYNLVVQAAPIFLTADSAPRDINASVGEDVNIQCNPYAIPDATVLWYKNGELLDPTQSSLFNRFMWSNNNRVLTILNVCKDNCTANDNGPMVIQCNASNINGYQYANGYVNVYVRTILTVKPVNVRAAILGRTYNFSVAATTDANTPLAYSWFFRPDDKTEWQPIVTRDSYVVSADMTLLTIQKLDDNVLGLYKVVASNGVSQDTSEFVIQQSTNIADVWPFWWIPLVIILVVILFIVIVCTVCCCIYKNRGDEYLVDLKEREAERNPEQELADNGFKDYQRQAYRPNDIEKQPLYDTMRR